MTLMKMESQNIVRGIPREISIRWILVMQLKKCLRKIFQLYVTHVLRSIEGGGTKLKYFFLLQEFNNVFMDEVSGFPPRGTLISQLTFYMVFPQCPRFLTG
jgi:hypothetical protein